MLNGRKSYNFSDKTHSRDGKFSTGMGIIAWIVFIVLVIQSINSKGNVGAWFGVLAVATGLISLCGFIIALISFKEEDVLPLFPRIGALSNGILFAIMVILFIIGL